MTHTYYMTEALKEAQKAYDKDEVPVGAVIVRNGKIIARAHNLIKSKNDPAGHAEILAIKKAAKVLNNERLNGTILYVNIEPCAMCAGAIILARVKTLVFGTPDKKTGACGSVYRIINNKKNNHQVEVVKNVLKQESAKIITDFFREKRKKLS